MEARVRRALTRAVLIAALIACMGLPRAVAAPMQDSRAVSRVESLVASTRAAMVGAPGDAERLAKEGQRLAATIADLERRELATLTFQWLRGEALVRLRRPAEARPLLREALARIEHTRQRAKLHGDILMSLANLDEAEGRAAEALEKYQRSFGVFRTLGERRSQAIALQNIAVLY